MSGELPTTQPQATGAPGAAQTLCSGRYVLERVLGTGGMATVHQAWDTSLEVHRAIKLLAPQLSANARFVRRFMDEARTMARLHHTNLVTIHDIGRDGPHVFMVMEMVGGGSLHDRIEREGALAPRAGVKLVCDVLSALEVCHAAGVIHRDIKPHNVLLDPDGTPRLADFGIAAITTRDHTLTKTGVTMGTWAYMAPEQRTDAKRARVQADIYAVAASLFHVLTGRVPHDLYVPQNLTRQLAGFPPELAAVLQQALAYDAEQRHATAQILRDRLLAILPGLPDSRLATAVTPDPDDAAPAAASISQETFDPGVDYSDDGSPDALLPSTPPLLPTADSISSEARSQPPAAHTVNFDATLMVAEAEAVAPAKSRAPWFIGGVLLLLVAGWAASQQMTTTGEPPPQTAATAPVSTPAAAPPIPAADSPLVDAVDAEPAPEPDPIAPTPAADTPAADTPAADTPAADTPAADTPAAHAAPRPPRQSEPAPQPAPSAPEAPPAPAEPGLLQLSSIQNAKLWLDGRAIGNSPQRVPADAGDHQIRWVRPNGDTFEHQVHIPSGETITVCWDLDTEQRCP